MLRQRVTSPRYGRPECPTSPVSQVLKTRAKRNSLEWPMSALGQKQTSCQNACMSAFDPKRTFGPRRFPPFTTVTARTTTGTDGSGQSREVLQAVRLLEHGIEAP